MSILSLNILSKSVNIMNVMEYLGKDSGLYCGYCNSKNGFVSHGMWLFTITPEDYEKLLNKGWRRSGNYLYKPVLNETCCPQYPIRCLTSDFKLSKSKRKIFKKVNKEFDQIESNNITFDGPRGDMGNYLSIEDNNFSKKQAQPFKSKYLFKKRSKSLPKTPNRNNKFELKRSKSNSNLILFSQKFQTFNMKFERKPTVENLVIKKKKKSLGNNKKYEKKFILRIEKNNEKSLEELVFSSHLKITFESLADISLNDPKVIEEYQIYHIYQTVVHKEKPEDLSVQAFCEFLIDTPLKNDGSGYGSFHMQYRYANELIAVGVIDILPHCISSVYFFYNPKYHRSSLGIYSILCEINLTRLLANEKPDIRYHYSGYYIHNCTKMNYKSQFQPAFLCSPDTEIWIPFNRWELDIKSELKVQSELSSEYVESIDSLRSNSKVLEYLLGLDVYNNSKIAF